MKVFTSLAAVAAAVAVMAVGCGGSSSTAPSAPQNVRLALDTKSTDGKALVISATTAKKLTAQEGSLYALELRGIDSGDSFDDPSFVDPNRCVGGGSCEWTVAPAKDGPTSTRPFSSTSSTTRPRASRTS